jgi:hypothetical protein
MCPLRKTGNFVANGFSTLYGASTGGYAMTGEGISEIGEQILRREDRRGNDKRNPVIDGRNVTGDMKRSFKIITGNR